MRPLPPVRDRGGAVTDREALTCPECGGLLALVTDGAIGRLVAPPFFIVGTSRLVEVRVPAPFVACTACEFCLEIVR
jgi:hypothetical protein